MNNNNSLPLISAVFAMSENRVIGNNNQLPWHLPADLKHFKALTTGHPIIMGRKTHQSIGRALPHRTNIVISHDPNYQAPGCVIVTSIDSAVATVQTAQEIFVIGGAQLFITMLPLIKRLYLTIIHQDFAGDVFFPALDANEWDETERVRFEADTNNHYAYSFIRLEKRTISKAR